MSEPEICKELRKELRKLQNNLLILTAKKQNRNLVIQKGLKTSQALQTAIFKIDQEIGKLTRQNQPTSNLVYQRQLIASRLNTLNADIIQFRNQLPSIITKERQVEGGVMQTTKRMMDEDCVL